MSPLGNIAIEGYYGNFGYAGTGLLEGSGMVNSTTLQKELSQFEVLLQSLGVDAGGNKTGANTETVASKDVLDSGRLNGDYTSGFAGTFTAESDKTARPQGAAAASGMAKSGATIDKTSKLYEKAMELESYFMKIMLSSMRATLGNSTLGGEKSYATKMYEDMMYDELAVNMTKHAGLGLADQIYLELI